MHKIHHKSRHLSSSIHTYSQDLFPLDFFSANFQFQKPIHIKEKRRLSFQLKKRNNLQGFFIGSWCGEINPTFIFLQEIFFLNNSKTSLPRMTSSCFVGATLHPCGSWRVMDLGYLCPGSMHSSSVFGSSWGR